jgi:outer membrane lipoprotein-sorting protein
VINARVLLAVCAVFVLGGMPASAADDDVGALMQLLAMRTHARSSFIEQQFLHLLKRPLESRGELTYDAPNRLEKKTIEPRTETLLVDGDVLTMERGHRRQVLNLRDYPALAPFIEGLRATLAGDRAALERLFDVTYSGSLSRWTLVLVPLAANVAKSVARIQIDGTQDDLLRIEILQPDGDRSLMTMRRAAAP